MDARCDLARLALAFWLGLLAPASARAVEVVITEPPGISVVIPDNGLDDENPAPGVIDLSLFLTAYYDIENYRCQVDVDGFTARARVLPIGGFQVRVANIDPVPRRVEIDCRHELGFEIWSPGVTEWRVIGAAEDTLQGTLDIIQLHALQFELLPPGGVAPAGPCPATGGPQPCSFDSYAVGDAFPPPFPQIFIADAVSVPMEIEIGGEDEVCFTQAEHSVRGAARVPVLGWDGRTAAIALLLAAGRSPTRVRARARASIAGSHPLS